MSSGIKDKSKSKAWKLVKLIEDKAYNFNYLNVFWKGAMYLTQSPTVISRKHTKLTLSLTWPCLSQQQQAEVQGCFRKWQNVAKSLQQKN